MILRHGWYFTASNVRKRDEGRGGNSERVEDEIIKTEVIDYTSGQQTQALPQIQPVVYLTNKNLLEHSHAYRLTHCLWWLVSHHSGAENRSRDPPGPAKPKPLLRSPAQMSLLTPQLDKSKGLRGHM